MSEVVKKFITVFYANWAWDGQGKRCLTNLWGCMERNYILTKSLTRSEFHYFLMQRKSEKISYIKNLKLIYFV